MGIRWTQTFWNPVTHTLRAELTRFCKPALQGQQGLLAPRRDAHTAAEDELSNRHAPMLGFNIDAHYQLNFLSVHSVAASFNNTPIRNISFSVS